MVVATAYARHQHFLLFALSLQNKIRKGINLSDVSDVSDFALSKLAFKIAAKGEYLVRLCELIFSDKDGELSSCLQINDLGVVQVFTYFHGSKSSDHRAVHLWKLLLMAQLDIGVASPSENTTTVIECQTMIRTCRDLLYVPEI